MNKRRRKKKFRVKKDRGASAPVQKEPISNTQHKKSYTKANNSSSILYKNFKRYTSKSMTSFYVSEYYNYLARDYDTFYNNTLSKTENKTVKDLILTNLGDLKFEKIVDLGCGTGQFNEMFPECENITGVDISKNMLDIARIKHPKGTFIQRDIVDTGLPKESAEVVVSLFGSLAYSDFDAVMKEVERILVPYGVCFLMHYNRFSLRNALRGFPKERKYSIRYSKNAWVPYKPVAKFYSKKDIIKIMDRYIGGNYVLPLYDYKIKAMPHNIIGIGIKSDKE